MKPSILYLFARTPVHVGSGSSVGAVDMPVQRERHTQIPIIPGSSLKGVLRDLFHGEPTEENLFGTESSQEDLRAGNLLVGEARVLCFPVRSARGAFAWLTSPLALQRFARDAGSPLPAIELNDGDCLAGPDVVLSGKNKVVLEENVFNQVAEPPPEVIALLESAVPNDPLWATLPQRIAIVSDGVFQHFCATACEVQQRIALNENKTVENLFNQENVPSETLFYAVMGERTGGALAAVGEKLAAHRVIQVGGDETVGLGFCSAHLAHGGVA